MTQSTSPIPAQPMQSSQQKNFPAWASLLVIVLCVALGGWLIWWYMGGEGNKRIVLDENSPQAKDFQNRRQNFGGPPQEMPVGIRQEGDAYSVRSGEVRMRVTKRNNAPDFRLDPIR